MYSEWSPLKAALVGFLVGTAMYLLFGPLIGTDGPLDPGADLIKFGAFSAVGTLGAIVVAVSRNRFMR